MPEGDNDTIRHDMIQIPEPSPVSQTDRTRLRSILISCSEMLEEWLEHLDILTNPNPNSDASESTSPNAEPIDITATLETIGLRERFEDLFSLTLSHMGAFSPVSES